MVAGLLGASTPWANSNSSLLATQRTAVPLSSLNSPHPSLSCSELGYGPGGKKSSANPDKCLALEGAETLQVKGGPAASWCWLTPSGLGSLLPYLLPCASAGRCLSYATPPTLPALHHAPQPLTHPPHPNPPHLNPTLQVAMGFGHSLFLVKDGDAVAAKAPVWEAPCERDEAAPTAAGGTKRKAPAGGAKSGGAKSKGKGKK